MQWRTTTLAAATLPIRYRNATMVLLRRRKKPVGKSIRSRLWVKMLGIRPAFFTALFFTIAGGAFHEWITMHERFAKIETNAEHDRADTRAALELAKQKCREN